MGINFRGRDLQEYVLKDSLKSSFKNFQDSIIFKWLKKEFDFALSAGRKFFFPRRAPTVEERISFHPNDKSYNTKFQDNLFYG